RIVESIPDNVTFHNFTFPLSTFHAWNRLIESAKRELYIAAYKSSLQGKHVLGLHSNLSHSISFKATKSMIDTIEGDTVYDALLHVGTVGGVSIKMVENFPPKDKGDNDDGIILQSFGTDCSLVFYFLYRL
ncbi:unnamed protein product, partial [Angiostrongylus costaricensis]|uniref:KR domain-containing protein n=1 Tax=Angiostrongylus costaricensis TaxID=334426 RepID=A0A0R3PBV2_ANGCS